MTILQRLLPLSAMAVAVVLAGCTETPTALTPADAGNQVLLKKGGGGSGGGSGGGGPAEITILFDDGVSGNGPNMSNLGYSIFGMDRTGAFTRVLSDADETNMGSLAPRWAPDGEHFVYSREVNTGIHHWEIVIGNVNGTITSILSVPPAPSLHYPDWSPVPLADGQYRIAFVQAGDLYVMRTDGSGVERLTTGLDIESLAWSRDASRILAGVRADELNAVPRLYLFAVSCDVSLCQMTGVDALDSSAPGVLPDGQLVVQDWAHQSDRVLIHMYGLGFNEIGILDLSDESPRFSLLTNTPGGQAYHGAWSWDDSEVVYVKWPGGKRPKNSIVIRNVSTGSETKIYDGDASFGMDWRPTPPSGG